MLVMLDTNVLISAIVFRSVIMNDIIKALAVKHKLVLCSYTIDELHEVIEYKFPTMRTHTETFFSSLPFERFDTPKPIPKHNLFKIRDADDEPVLYSAIIANVDILITGDKDFLDTNVKRPEIMTPSEFLHNYC